MLFEPLGSTKNPEIGSLKIESRIFYIKFIILPAVLHLQLNLILAVFHARPQRSWIFKLIVH